MILLIFALVLSDPQPPLGLTTKAKVVRVLDGDTLEVEIVTRVRVRLLDCWAPELREEGGTESKEHLSSLAKKGSTVVLHVPTSGTRRLDDVLTFGRLLGRIYAKGEDVGSRMVEDGHATKERL